MSLKPVFQSMFQPLWQRTVQPGVKRWLDRRIPPAKKVHLTQNKLFILPTASGYGFLLLTFVMWVLATNYQNNLILAIAFFLLSLFVTAILHSFVNLSGLTVCFVGAEPVFMGEQAQIEVLLSQSAKKMRQGITLKFKKLPWLETQLLGCGESRVVLSCHAANRGWFRPGRVTVQSCYPLGLFKVWTHLDLDCKVLVYPKPVYQAPQGNSVGTQGDGILALSAGSDDFTGFKSYASGEPLQHVAWKHYARERGLYLKQYGDTVDERLWVDWDLYPHCEREARLSRLCGLLLEISKKEVQYGLKLPSLEIPVGQGDRHQKAILRELALFETEQSMSGSQGNTGRHSINNSGGFR